MEWIKTSDRLPVSDIYEEIIFSDGKRVYFGSYFYVQSETNYFHAYMDSNVKDIYITHWMSKPKPPKD